MEVPLIFRYILGSLVLVFVLVLVFWGPGNVHLIQEITADAEDNGEQHEAGNDAHASGVFDEAQVN